MITRQFRGSVRGFNSAAVVKLGSMKNKDRVLDTQFEYHQDMKSAGGRSSPN